MLKQANNLKKLLKIKFDIEKCYFVYQKHNLTFCAVKSYKKSHSAWKIHLSDAHYREKDIRTALKATFLYVKILPFSSMLRSNRKSPRFSTFVKNVALSCSNISFPLVLMMEYNLVASKFLFWNCGCFEHGHFYRQVTLSDTRTKKK